MQRCSDKVEKEDTPTRSGEKLCATESTEERWIGSGLAGCITMMSSKEAAGEGVTEEETHATDVAVAAAKEGATEEKARCSTMMSSKEAAGGGVIAVEKHAMDVAVAAAEEGDTGNEDGPLSQEFVDDALKWTLDGPLTRLSQEFVDEILEWKLDTVQDPVEYYNSLTKEELQCFSQEFIDEDIEIMRDIAEMCKRNNARFEVFRTWVRAQYTEKGYVEVDDSYIARRILLYQAMEEEEWDWDDVEGLVCEGDNE